MALERGLLTNSTKESTVNSMNSMLSRDVRSKLANGVFTRCGAHAVQ